MTQMTELLFMRHAPVADASLMTGRRDVAATVPGADPMRKITAMFGAIDAVVSSPAMRCRQTAQAIFPDRTIEFDERLWEQDFGEWEGIAYASLPDLGPLDRAELAAHRPLGGESFGDLTRRCRPALEEIAQRGGRVLVVAHAGTIRAALSLALGDEAAGLAFEIAPLSLTRVKALGEGHWSIAEVNRTFDH